MSGMAFNGRRITWTMLSSFFIFFCSVKVLNLIEKSPRMEVIEYLLQVRLSLFYFSLEWGTHTSPCHLPFIVNTFRGFKGPFMFSTIIIVHLLHCMTGYMSCVSKGSNNGVFRVLWDWQPPVFSAWCPAHQIVRADDPLATYQVVII